MFDQQVPSAWVDVPASSGLLAVGDSHRIRWYCYGHTDALPVLSLHGGPGSGSNPQHLMFFDPKMHRVIMFDQRGSGRSTPTGAIFSNTTQDLLSDIEKLRQRLRIRRWLVFGVSWGASLALLYGQYHTKSSVGLVLACLSNRADYQTDWILKERARVLPERHREFLKALTPDERINPISAYYRKSLSAERQDQLEAAYAVWILEVGLKGPEPETLPTMTLEQIDESMYQRAKIFLHYWANRSFLSHGHLLITPDALDDLSVRLVHGESDWICPLSGAQQVSSALDGAEIIVVPKTGHSPYGARIMQALRDSIMAFGSRDQLP